MKTGLLTAEDLVEITGGYTRGADQTRFLREQGLRPFPGRDGHPRITWEAINAAMSPGAVPVAVVEPNWGAVRGRA